MPAKWSSLKSGERHEFVCLQIDIAGHSKLDDSERILHEVKELFHKQIAGLVAIHDGQPFKWEGDGGAFLFLSTESRAFDESVYAAFDILDALPRINDQLRMAHQLSQTLSVRISLDTGVAVYDKDPGLITGDFLNAFLKHERAISLVNAVTITDRVHRQISGPLRGRFTGSKHSEELGCRIYRSVSAEPKTAPDTSPEVKPPRSQPADTPQGPPPGNVFQPPRQASVSSNRISLAMSKTVFVSYSHKQGDWVWDRLMNCLKAGGTEVLIDREQVEAARRLYQQLDDVQDRAALNVLVFSPEYLNSKYCRHEMRRALRRDPKFDRGIVIPVKRVECELPPAIRRWDSLCVDLRDDQNTVQWDYLLKKCDADLGTTAPEWLRVRDELRRDLGRGESVNLIAGVGARWRQLIEDLRRDSPLAELGVVDLQNPVTAARPGLVGAILQACGITGLPVPDKPNDLVELGRRLPSHRTARVALTGFDLAPHRPDYGLDLFATLRYLTMESRQLALLIQSRTNFAALLPRDHPLSSIDLKTVELKGRP